MKRHNFASAANRWCARDLSEALWMKEQPAAASRLGLALRAFERVSLSTDDLDAWQSMARNTKGSSSRPRTALRPLETKVLEPVREKLSQNPLRAETLAIAGSCRLPALASTSDFPSHTFSIVLTISLSFK